MPDREAPLVETDISLQQVRRLALGARGASVREPRLGVGSFLTFELVRGGDGSGSRPWYFWLYQCAWRIDAAAQVVGGSEDERDELGRAVHRLEGARLEQIDIAASQEASLVFADGLSLRMFPVYSRGYINWMLWLPDGDVISAGPGRRWTRESGRSIGSGPG
jgi:hypothetical protein